MNGEAEVNTSPIIVHRQVFNGVHERWLFPSGAVSGHDVYNYCFRNIIDNNSVGQGKQQCMLTFTDWLIILTRGTQRSLL